MNLKNKLYFLFIFLSLIFINNVNAIELILPKSDNFNHEIDKYIIKVDNKWETDLQVKEFCKHVIIPLGQQYLNYASQIIDSKSVFESISRLLEESLWLSVAPPVKNDLFSKLVLCK